MRHASMLGSTEIECKKISEIYLEIGPNFFSSFYFQFMDLGIANMALMLHFAPGNSPHGLALCIGQPVGGIEFAPNVEIAAVHRKNIRRAGNDHAMQFGAARAFLGGPGFADCTYIAHLPPPSRR